MKNEVPNFKFICQSMALVLLMGICSTALAQQPVIKVKVNDDQTALEIVDTQNTNPCPVAGYGSICVPVGKRDTKIKYQLSGDNPCNREGGNQWELSQVVLGGEGSETKPANDNWGGLSRGAASDFKADANTGVVIGVHPTNETVITVQDDNNHKVDLWYKIEAVCKSSDGQQVGDPINLDPRIRNGGTG